LEGGPDPARHHDEGRGKTDEVMESREEGPVTEHLVDKGVRVLLGRQMNGETKRPRVALDLSLDGAGVRSLHEAGTASGNDVDAHVSELIAQLLDLVVDGIATAYPRAAEDRDAVVLDALRLNLV